MLFRSIFEGVKTDVSKRSLIPFGTVVLVPTPEDKDQRASMGVTLGPSTLTYGANTYYLIATKKIVKSKSVIVQEYIPSDFPWTVKSGRHQFTVLKRSKKRKSNRKTATNNDTTNSVSTQRANVERVSSEPSPDRELYSGREGELSDQNPKQTEQLPEPPLSKLDGNRRHVKASGTQIAQPTQTVRPEHKLSTEQAQNEALNKFLQNRKDKESQNKEILTEDIQVLMSALLEARDNQKQNEFRTNIAEARIQTLDNGYDPPTTRRKNVRQEPEAQVRPRHTSKPKKKKAVKLRRTAKIEISPPASPRRPKARENSTAPIGKRQSERQAEKRLRKNTLKAARLVYKAFRISVRQGLEGEYAQESKEAIISEIQNMLQYRVGHYIRRADIPKDKLGNILQSFMFLKHKTFPDGTYDKTKARMVGNHP